MHWRTLFNRARLRNYMRLDRNFFMHASVKIELKANKLIVISLRINSPRFI